MTVKGSCTTLDCGNGTSDGPSQMTIQRLTSRMVSHGSRCNINHLLQQLSPNCPQYLSDHALEYLLDNPNLIVLVVVDNKTNEVIGISSALFCPTLSSMSISIGDVVVDKRHRGKGIGEALIENLIKRVKEKNDPMVDHQKATHISLTSNPAREAANKLYQKLGFQTRDTNVYHLPL